MAITQQQPPWWQIFGGGNAAPAVTPLDRQTGQPVPDTSAGFGTILATLSPQEKQMLLAQTLAGAAGAAGQLNPRASIGQVLATAAGGAGAGNFQALRGIQVGRSLDRTDQIQQGRLDRQKRADEQEAARKAQLQSLMVSMPPEQRAMLETATAMGKPDLAYQSMYPKPMGPADRYRVAGTDVIDLAAEGGPKIALRGSRDAGPLVPVFDPETGQASYATREQALGHMAPPKSGGVQITGYDEQGRPLIQVGGSSQAGAMQKPTAANIEKQMVDMGGKMQRLDLIAKSYRPEYSEIPNRVGFEWSTLKDKFGQLDPAKRQELSAYTTWRANAAQDMNQTIHDLSGAAVTPQEYERLARAMPNAGTGVGDGDSPTEFKAKLDAQIYQAKLAYARLAYYRSHGLPAPDFAGNNNGGTSLADMPKIIDARGQELEQQLRQQNPNVPADQIAQQVDQQLRAEFGL